MLTSKRIQKMAGAVIAICLLTSIILPAIAVNASTGHYGDNLSYALKNGVLTISGKGEMRIPQMALEEIPWHLDSDSITKVTIESGVSNIGMQAFYECSNMSSISIPQSVKSIQRSAFYGCNSLTDVYYDGTNSEWNSILISEGNSILENARLHYKEFVFRDVNANSWYAEPVAWAVSQGITTGTSQTAFSPDDTCTNAQVLTFIWRACRSPEPSISNPFKDISENDYYYKAALWACESKMVEGDYFQPQKPCSRSLAVTYLWKEAGSPTSFSQKNFTDVNPNSAYAQAITWAVEAGITNGTSDLTFSPEVTCSRAQIITFLYRDMVEPQAGNGSSSLEIKT